MNTDQIRISINKFLTNYLGVNLDYSTKKWTHAKLNEILVEHNMTDCILNNHIDLEDLYSGEVLAVVDQVGKIKFYRNPQKNTLITPNDSFCIKYELDKKEKELNQLRKTRITDLSEVDVLFKRVIDLEQDISDLKGYLELVLVQEQQEQKERDKYNRKTKRRGKYEKYKRR